MDNHFRIRQSVQERKREAFLRHAKHYNDRMKVRHFAVNDVVFYMRNHSGPMFRKFQAKWEGPAKVVSVETDGNLWIENLLTNRRYFLHCNRLKPGSVEDQIYRQPLPSKNGEPNDASSTDTDANDANDDGVAEGNEPQVVRGPLTRARARALRAGGQPQVIAPINCMQLHNLARKQEKYG